MMSRDTTQKGAGHTDLRTFDASSDRSAQRDNITTVTSTSPEHVRIQNVRTPSETEPHLERNIAGSEELELHEPTKPRKHETTQGIMLQEVGSNVDDIKESDGYHPIILDVDSDQKDVGWAIGGSLCSPMASMRSRIHDSIVENGRTYHTYKQGSYYLPNDEVEQERLDLQHHLFIETLEGKLNLAPVQNPRNVLDIGTGTGIWAIDFATQNPSAEVIGTDLSLIQPHYVPPNCQFRVDDAEDVWTYDRKFDYIHGRALFSCFKDPAAVFKKAHDNLTPGGYFEMQDVYFKPHSNDGTLDGTAFERWNEMIVEGAKKLNRDWHCVKHYKRWFEEVGFEDVVERSFYWPMNPWAKGKRMKTIGLWSMQNALEGANSISMAIMTRVLGMSPDEVERRLEEVKHNIKDSSIHSYWPVYVVYGRKPL